MVTGRTSSPPALLRGSKTAHSFHLQRANDANLAAAWAAVHDATPEGWYVGRLYFDERHNRWEQYAYDPTEKPVVGKRSREWTAVAPNEPRCVQEVAYCLAELREGRWPR